MSLTGLLGLIVILCVLGYVLGRQRAAAVARDSGVKLHSRPQYYGAFVALACGLPIFLLLLVWLAFDEQIIRGLVVASLPDEVTELQPERIGLVLNEITNVAGGRMFGTPEPYIQEAAGLYNRLQGLSGWALFVVTLCLGILGLALARGRVAPEFQARNQVERITNVLLIIASCIAILTTLGIVLSLLVESWRFFQLVPVTEFLFGLRWEPQIAIRPDQVAGAGAFGAVPVFWGTIFIALISMLVALPIGLLSAIYMAEYATPRFRSVVKPILEILAGVPTIVYGFFAVLTVAPALRYYGGLIGIDVAANSALAAGAVMGIMIIPFISSFADDALTAVPRSLRDGSLGLGATRAETVTQVLLPAALPGIVGGVLLAVSRALGETMIVVMAAGLIARLTANPLEGVTTVTVQIVTLLIGDTAFDSPKTLAAFGLGVVLFLSTLVLNVAAINVVKKYRQTYE